jgi:hypothetical protein
MTKRKWLIFVLTLGLIGGTAGFLVHLKASQRLGQPGVKLSRAADTGKLQIDLPAKVLDYKSVLVEPEAAVTQTLPKDTTFGQRRYQAESGFWTDLTVVLMGTDRTSIHKPQFCLTGQGWTINEAVHATVEVARPHPYQVPVMKLLTTKKFSGSNGEVTTYRGIFIYWFVADQHLTEQHWQRMWWMARDLVRSGTLQRWAYVSCFSPCLPGQEEQASERIKQFIAAAVPEFQLTTGEPVDRSLAARRP